MIRTRVDSIVNNSRKKEFFHKTGIFGRVEQYVCGLYATNLL
jgi:hypothetical protein